MSIVRHKTFGEGTVNSVADGYIEIDFSGQVKKFLFPKAFEAFLMTEDKDLLQKITEAKLIAEAKEKAAKEAKAAAEKEVSVSTPIYTSPAKGSYTYSRSYDHSVSHPLVGERAQTIDVGSEEEMFELVGYMAAPYRVSSFEAEVPKDGRDETFEKLFPGQTYRPIELGDTPSGMPNKLSPQFRINFSDLSNCPDILRKNMGKGTGSCVGRINKSKFVIDLVQNYGFRFGDWQDRDAIRKIAIKRGCVEAFDRGYLR